MVLESSYNSKEPIFFEVSAGLINGSVNPVSLNNLLVGFYLSPRRVLRSFFKRYFCAMFCGYSTRNTRKLV